MDDPKTEATPPGDSVLPAPVIAVTERPVLQDTALEALIERWWSEFFSGSPVAQITTAWNVAFAAKEELKRRLKGSV